MRSAESITTFYMLLKISIKDELRGVFFNTDQMTFRWDRLAYIMSLQFIVFASSLIGAFFFQRVVDEDQLYQILFAPVFVGGISIIALISLFCGGLLLFFVMLYQDEQDSFLYLLPLGPRERLMVRGLPPIFAGMLILLYPVFFGTIFFAIGWSIDLQTFLLIILILFLTIVSMLVWGTVGAGFLSRYMPYHNRSQYLLGIAILIIVIILVLAFYSANHMDWNESNMNSVVGQVYAFLTKPFLPTAWLTGFFFHGQVEGMVSWNALRYFLQFLGFTVLGISLLPLTWSGSFKDDGKPEICRDRKRKPPKRRGDVLFSLIKCFPASEVFKVFFWKDIRLFTRQTAVLIRFIILLGTVLITTMIFDTAAWVLFILFFAPFEFVQDFFLPSFQSDSSNFHYIQMLMEGREFIYVKMLSGGVFTLSMCIPLLVWAICCNTVLGEDMVSLSTLFLFMVLTVILAVLHGMRKGRALCIEKVRGSEHSIAHYQLTLCIALSLMTLYIYLFDVGNVPAFFQRYVFLVVPGFLLITAYFGYREVKLFLNHFVQPGE